MSGDMEPKAAADLKDMKDVELGQVAPDPSEACSDDSEHSLESPAVQALCVCFKDVSYRVINSGNWFKKAVLLSRVSGLLRPGEMTALMGPSGSGKTTLLDLLAGRKTVGKMEGKILFAGRRPTRTFLRRYTGYVEQFDTLIDNLTVEEMLLYTAELKNARSESRAAKRARVETVLGQLALESCRHVHIGSALNRGISGGQAKRTNIGIALVTNPRVLFLDEPTSGLDSYTANEVVEVVKALVKTGITICATVHSPTPYTFALFDRLTILLHGHVVYSGPNGQEAVRFFEMSNPAVPRFGAPRPGSLRGGLFARDNNMAEWLVDLTTRADREGRWGDFARAYEGSALYERNAAEVAAEAGGEQQVTQAIKSELDVRQATATPVWYGIWTILRYRLPRDFSDPAYLGPRIVDKFVVSFVLMTLYWKVGRKPPPLNSINIGAALFMWSILPGFAAASYTPTLVQERPVYYRERADGLYRPLTYLTAKVVSEVLVALLASLPLSCMVFFPLFLHGSWAVFWLAYFVTTCIGIVLAYFIAAMAPNLAVANAALPAFVVLMLFFVGLLLRPSDQPGYWHWVSYVDFLHYSWVAQMVNQFAGQQIEIFLTIDLLTYYGLNNKNKWQYIGYEAIFFFAFFAFALLALTFVKHQKR